MSSEKLSVETIYRSWDSNGECIEVGPEQADEAITVKQYDAGEVAKAKVLTLSAQQAAQLAAHLAKVLDDLGHVDAGIV
jgi:hypothetical protein